MQSTPEPDFRISSDKIQAGFGSKDTGCTLQSVTSREESVTYQLNPNQETPFWVAEFRNEEGQSLHVDSLLRFYNDRGHPISTPDVGSFTYEVTEGDKQITAVLRWQEIPLEFDSNQGEATVELELQLSHQSTVAHWSPTVSFSGEKVTLWEFTFPSGGDVHQKGSDRKDDELVLPHGWGERIRNPTAKSDLTTDHPQLETYPSANWTMQFFSVVNSGHGFYAGFHDPDGRPKTFDVSSPVDSSQLSFQVDHHPEEMGRNQSEYECGYDVVFELFSGGWYTAAKRYREWALQEAPWVGNGPVVERDDIPAWFKKMSLWVRYWSGRGDVTDDEALLREFAATSPVSLGIHWYRWHEAPFDTSYPDYVPRDRWEEMVTRLQDEADIRVMPYINARIADMNSDSWDRDDLESGLAMRSSARYSPSNQLPYVEEYGNGQQLLPMCPSTAVWSTKVEQIVERLVNDIGVAGVYLDQISASGPRLCFDPEHDHPPGGGAYGVQAYQRLLATIVDQLQGDESMAALTSESNAEPYLHLLSGNLMFQAPEGEDIPLFPTIYGEYALLFGRVFREGDIEDDIFSAKVAQMFSYGVQLGWFSNVLIEKLLSDEQSDNRAYLFETARVLEDHWECIAAGRRLREATPPMEMEPIEHPETEKSIHPVVVVPWEHPNENRLGISVTNWTDNDRSGSWRLNHEGLVSEESTLKQRSETSLNSSHRIEGDELMLTMTVPAKSTAFIELDD